jgi:DNA-directed RNA polymerase specialized sigma24 family protein
MARIDDVERRLLNWARWLLGGRSGGLGYATVSYGAVGADSSKFREAVIPTSEAEAVDTDDAVKQLANELRQVVWLHYREGQSVASLSVRICCSVATVYNRLDRAHRQLDQVFCDQANARRAERARVENIAAAARVARGFRD